MGDYTLTGWLRSTDIVIETETEVAVTVTFGWGTDLETAETKTIIAVGDEITATLATETDVNPTGTEQGRRTGGDTAAVTIGMLIETIGGAKIPAIDPASVGTVQTLGRGATIATHEQRP
jgi:hypothetical protein